MKNAADILKEASKTFLERNKVYGDNYKSVGRVMKALFPNGVNLKTEEDLDKQVEKGTYNIDWFIDNKYALPGIKNTNDFQILIKD